MAFLPTFLFIIRQETDAAGGKAGLVGEHPGSSVLPECLERGGLGVTGDRQAELRDGSRLVFSLFLIEVGKAKSKTSPAGPG